MTLFHSSPPEGWDPDLPWPFYRIVYTTLFWGPLGGGVLVGIVLGGYVGIAISLPVSGVIWLPSAVLFDRFLHERIPRLQKITSRLIPRVLVNVVGMALVIGLTALSMFATGVLLLRLGYGVDVF